MLSEDQQTEVVTFYTTLAAGDTAPSDLFPDLSFQIFRQLINEDSFPEDRIEKWGKDEFVKGRVDDLYSDYIDDIEATLVGGIQDKLNYRQIAALGEMREDQGKLSTAKCAAKSEVPEWKDRWSACEADGAPTLSTDEKAAFQALLDAIPGVLGSDTSLTYFGGTTCRLFAQFQQEVSKDGFSVSLEDIKLNLGNSEKAECEELRDRLLELRLDKNPGKLIER